MPSEKEFPPPEKWKWNEKHAGRPGNTARFKADYQMWDAEALKTSNLAEYVHEAYQAALKQLYKSAEAEGKLIDHDTIKWTHRATDGPHVLRLEATAYSYPDDPVLKNNAKRARTAARKERYGYL